MLHSVFASTNDKHCPHISFVPVADSSGSLKCQESAGLLPGDTVTDQDMQAFNDWMVEEGLSGTGVDANPTDPTTGKRLAFAA
jgi:hypothetical protein